MSHAERREEREAAGEDDDEEDDTPVVIPSSAVTTYPNEGNPSADAVYKGTSDRRYNEGYKVDLAEPHAGPGGCDEVNEIKLWTPLLKTSSPGVGNASSGGTPASVGHSYAFGNTEEKARRLNMGCKARGQPSQPFSHKTGHGYVKAHRGFYHDAIFVKPKRNNFNLLLHETFGGGFSPTAVLKLRRLARKVARGSVDRTAYLLAQVLALFCVCPTMQSASLSLLCEA